MLFVVIDITWAQNHSKYMSFQSLMTLMIAVYQHDDIEFRGIPASEWFAKLLCDEHYEKSDNLALNPVTLLSKNTNLAAVTENAFSWSRFWSKFLSALENRQSSLSQPNNQKSS